MTVCSQTDWPEQRALALACFYATLFPSSWKSNWETVFRILRIIILPFTSYLILVLDTEAHLDASSVKPSSKGGVYLHLVRVPHGPSLTFSVCEYSLKRDVTTLIRRVFNSNQFRTPPLLAMTGFGSLCPDAPGSKQPQPPPPHLRLVVDMFQNMLPPLNVQKVIHCL